MVCQCVTSKDVEKIIQQDLDNPNFKFDFNKTDCINIFNAIYYQNNPDSFLNGMENAVNNAFNQQHNTMQMKQSANAIKFNESQMRQGIEDLSDQIELVQEETLQFLSKVEKHSNNQSQFKSSQFGKIGMFHDKVKNVDNQVTNVVRHNLDEILARLLQVNELQGALGQESVPAKQIETWFNKQSVDALLKTNVEDLLEQNISPQKSMNITTLK